ncbi:MAG: T9SS type A sorting domain-containing protein, partial [Bacteroidota bacterium]
PTTGDVTLQLPENEETRMIKLEITDINGLCKISEDLPSLRQNTVSIESLSPGMYFLHVTTEKSKETVKIVKW